MDKQKSHRGQVAALGLSNIFLILFHFSSANSNSKNVSYRLSFFFVYFRPSNYFKFLVFVKNSFPSNRFFHFAVILRMTRGEFLRRRAELPETFFGGEFKTFQCWGG
jgi:hypothetical protein